MALVSVKLPTDPCGKQTATVQVCQDRHKTSTTLTDSLSIGYHLTYLAANCGSIPKTVKVFATIFAGSGM